MKRLLIAFVFLCAAAGTAIGQPIADKLLQARRCLDQGKLTEARQLIGPIGGQDSLNTVALYGRAMIDEYYGYQWEALISYLALAPKEGGFLPAIEAFTRLAIDLDYLPNARKMAAIYITKEPSNPKPYLAMAKINMLEHAFDSARAYIAEAAKRTTDAREIGLWVAEIEARSGAVDSALGLLSRARPESSRHFQHRAEIYHFLNMIDSTVAGLQRALDLDKTNITLKLQLGWYLYDVRRLKEAKDLVHQVTSQAETCGEAFVLGAYVERALGHSIEADLSFYKFLELNLNSPLSLDRYADYQTAFHDDKAAVGDYQSAYIMANNKGYPDDYLRRLYLKMMNSLLANRDIQGAIDFLEDGKLLLAGLPEANFLKAELMRRFPEASDSTRLLIDDSLSFYDANRHWLELAAAYYSRAGQIDRAIGIYRKLIDLPYPEQDYYSGLLALYATTKNSLAADGLAASLPLRFRQSRKLLEDFYDLYHAIGQKAQATAYAEALYRMAPSHLPYAVSLAKLYEEQGRADAARDLLARYAQKYPDDPQAHYQLADMEYHAGRMDSILSRLNRAAALDTAYGAAYELRGIYLRDKGNIDSAMANFRRAALLGWPSPYSYYYLGEYLLQKGDSLDRAAGLGMAAIRFFGADRRGYHLLGRVYLAQAKYKLAQTQFLAALKLSPEDAEIHFLLGKTLLKSGSVDQAKVHLNDALKYNLASPEREEAEKLLRE